MKFFIAIIIVVLLALSLFLFLAMSVGVAFSLVWIFLAISFEIGVLIGAVSLGMIFLVFIKIINASSKTYLPYIDDNDIFDKVYVNMIWITSYRQDQHEVIEEKDVNLLFSFPRSGITVLNSVKLLFNATP
jgi:hypothetical protein